GPSSGSAASGTAGPSTVGGAPAFQNGHRVDARGNITLPLIGSVRAAGRTPAQLERDVAARLVSAGIAPRPPAAVQSAESRSHVAAVVGSVERPGTYPLTRPGATVADMIWAAGGPGKEAGRIVTFSPGGGAEAVRLAASNATKSDADPQGGNALPASTSSPIRIDLQALLHAAESGRTSLNPPVRPGDVISVSGAGSVLIEGWVDKPGSFR